MVTGAFSTWPVIGGQWRNGKHGSGFTGSQASSSVLTQGIHISWPAKRPGIALPRPAHSLPRAKSRSAYDALI